MTETNNSCNLENFASVQQLHKKEEGQGRKPIYPPTVIQAVFDAKTGAPLEAILAQYNNIYVQYQGSPEATRNVIPETMRRAGLMITYMNMESEVITERASSAVQKDNEHWGLDANWTIICDDLFAGIVQQTGDKTNVVMSQAAVTALFTQLNESLSILSQDLAALQERVSALEGT